MTREIEAYDLELFAKNTGELYETHKKIAQSNSVWAWTKHVRDVVLPLYGRQVEPVWAREKTVHAVADELCDYYRNHLREIEGVK